MASRLRSLNISKFVNVLKHSKKQCVPQFLQKRCFAAQNPQSTGSKSSSKYLIFSALGSLGIGAGLYNLAAPDRSVRNMESDAATENVNFSKNPNIMDIKPSREVLGPANNLGLNFTLYQYQTCPFCCKVRAFLEFYGIPYKIIEVNPVMRQQLKFSSYKKVPILIVNEEKPNIKHQLNDSSVIISILGTLLIDLNIGLEAVLKYYVPLVFKNEDGKEVEQIMNKYFLMYGDKVPKEKNDEYLKKERRWREWADNELVHILSPNIYRTYDEALQAFNYFSDVGEWEKNFSTLERLVVIYIGATAMYFIGRKLKKKYRLKDDVRQSLYDACKIWMKEIGSKQKFLGGDIPNLADLAVYGLLTSIEGCVTFQDLLNNTKIGPWYYNMKEAVSNHHGYQSLKL